MAAKGRFPQENHSLQLNPLLLMVGRSLLFGVLIAAAFVAIAFLLGEGLGKVLETVGVVESLTRALADALIMLAPYAGIAAAAYTLRSITREKPLNGAAAVVTAVLILFAITVFGQQIAQTGPFAISPSLQFSLTQIDGGIRVDAVEAGGAADQAGFQAGDLITAIRRTPISLNDLVEQIAVSSPEEVLRLRIIRDGEEQQLTTRVALVVNQNNAVLLRNGIFALLLAGVVVLLPAVSLPYLILISGLIPLLVGYTWLIIATFSYRTEGLTPITETGEIGFTLDNWRFLFGERIAGIEIFLLQTTINSLAVAFGMTVGVLLVCSMAGYALARMNFPGRRLILSLTLILHGFPVATLIIPVFMVLTIISNVPILGDIAGYNTVGGIALVMVTFELPLGIWLMKGFFDGISWDMERSALIDGASRFRTFWEIILPQIRPGVLALGIFSFISGWNAYLIPATYSLGTRASTLPVLIRSLVGDETSPVDWNQVAAVAMFQLIPILIFFIFAQEYLLNIYSGGSKGSS